jgi:hypothetical protein
MSVAAWIQTERMSIMVMGFMPDLLRDLVRSFLAKGYRNGGRKSTKMWGIVFNHPPNILKGFSNKCKRENLLGLMWVKNIPWALRD